MPSLQCVVSPTHSLSCVAHSDRIFSFISWYYIPTCVIDYLLSPPFDLSLMWPNLSWPAKLHEVWCYQGITGRTNFQKEVTGQSGETIYEFNGQMIGTKANLNMGGYRLWLAWESRHFSILNVLLRRPQSFLKLENCPHVVLSLRAPWNRILWTYKYIVKTLTR